MTMKSDARIRESYKDPDLTNALNDQLEVKNLRIIVSALVAQLEEVGARARVAKSAFGQTSGCRIRTSSDPVTGDVLLFTA